jgi:hypothetical protein
MKKMHKLSLLYVELWRLSGQTALPFRIDSPGNGSNPSRPDRQESPSGQELQTVAFCRARLDSVMVCPHTWDIELRNPRGVRAGQESIWTQLPEKLWFSI